MAYDDALGERIRDRLRDTFGVAEKRIFGGLVLFLYGNMVVSAFAGCLRRFNVEP